MKKIGIWGWWQGKNLGDNWIKRVLKEHFEEADFLPTSVKNFSEYDFIICGGGGLFIYDVIEPFKKIDFEVPFGILGIGAEFKHKSFLAKNLEEKASFFYARDQYSIDCMHISNECKSYDVTFLNPLPYEEVENLDGGKVFFVWRDCRKLLENDEFDKYIEFSDNKDGWYECINNNFNEIVYDDFQTRDDDILKRIDNCGFVISGRYHGIVAAIQRGLPFLAIDICPKIRALANECGLSEYCIKISELNKAEKLIKQAKKDIDIIRKKEYEYRKNATITLANQIVKVKNIINKATNSIRILHYGSYWMGENDVVCAMSDDLLDACESQRIDLQAYSNIVDKRIKKIKKTPNGMICTLDTDMIIKDINDFKPNAVILNSGGLCFDDKLKKEFKNRNIISVGISLSDPDVYPYNGKVYANQFDLFYTNSRYSLEEQYDSNEVDIHLLPFAASKKHHYYMPKVKKEYDLVVVGHARPDRVKTVNKIRSVCRIGLFGFGWEDGHGTVRGYEQVRAINSGKMYLSFSHTTSGYNNVKVGLFEAVACNQFVITSYMEELSEYFDIGKEIVCYKNEEELIDLIKYYKEHDTEREKIRYYGYLRFLREHTYISRWNKVFFDIKNKVD